MSALDVFLYGFFIGAFLSLRVVGRHVMDTKTYVQGFRMSIWLIFALVLILWAVHIDHQPESIEDNPTVPLNLEASK